MLRFQPNVSDRVMNEVEDRMWWYRSLHGHAAALLTQLQQQGVVLGTRP